MSNHYIDLKPRATVYSTALSDGTSAEMNACRVPCKYVNCCPGHGGHLLCAVSLPSKHWLPLDFLNTGHSSIQVSRMPDLIPSRSSQSINMSVSGKPSTPDRHEFRLDGARCLRKTIPSDPFHPNFTECIAVKAKWLFHATHSVMYPVSVNLKSIF